MLDQAPLSLPQRHLFIRFGRDRQEKSAHKPWASNEDLRKPLYTGVSRIGHNPNSREKAQKAQKPSFLAPFAPFRGYSIRGWCRPSHEPVSRRRRQESLNGFALQGRPLPSETIDPQRDTRGLKNRKWPCKNFAPSRLPTPFAICHLPFSILSEPAPAPSIGGAVCGGFRAFGISNFGFFIVRSHGRRARAA